MPKWKHTVIIGDLHGAREREEIQISEVAKQFAARLKLLPKDIVEDLTDDIDLLEELASDTDTPEQEKIEEYDCILESLYSYGDAYHTIWFDSTRHRNRPNEN
jgi:hypothetical protein